MQLEMVDSAPGKGRWLVGNLKFTGLTSNLGQL
jgi:hypothetical protein